MKATDLRIGNSIMINRSIIPQIGYSVIMDFYLKQKGVDNNYLNNLTFEPIPLTEQTLLSFKGFKRRQEGFIGIHLRSGIWLEVNLKTKRTILFHNDTYTALKHVTHVHTLQNVYFFNKLTGEELTIQ